MSDLDGPVRVAKSGRSFDFAGYRIRLEGSAHDANDQVPEVVTFIASAIEAYQRTIQRNVAALDPDPAAT